MNTFYKISKEDANTVGYFEYSEGSAFSPFCAEQVDGTYLVATSLVEELKDNENILKVDWTSMTIIDESQIDNKPVPFPFENP
jgi:plasmid replication initiation protein